MEQYVAAVAHPGGARGGSPLEASAQYFNPHSPPILNLSPNLSPREAQRNSPSYDLRETTRRRSIQGAWVFCDIVIELLCIYGISSWCATNTGVRVAT